MAVNDTEPDHPAYRGLPSIRYALTQHRRAAAGWVALAGNHVLIDSGGIIVALCHLQQGSIQVARGQQVHAGSALAGVAATPATAPSLTFTSRQSTASTSHAPTPFA